MYRKYSDERIKATILQKLALYERLIYIYDKEAANAALNSTLLSVNTKGDVV